MAGMPVRLRRGELGACGAAVRDAVRGRSALRFPTQEDRASGDWGVTDAQGFYVVPRRVAR